MSWWIEVSLITHESVRENPKNVISIEYSAGMLKKLRIALRYARMDTELQEIITEGNHTRESANAIREFLLKVLQEDIDGKEKFNDEILQEAAELIEELGPGAFYWMTDIAVQMTVLAQCALRDVPTNVEAELGKDASAADIIKNVVRV